MLLAVRNARGRSIVVRVGPRVRLDLEGDSHTVRIERAGVLPADPRHVLVPGAGQPNVDFEDDRPRGCADRVFVEHHRTDVVLREIDETLLTLFELVRALLLREHETVVHVYLALRRRRQAGGNDAVEGEVTGLRHHDARVVIGFDVSGPAGAVDASRDPQRSVSVVAQALEEDLLPRAL